MPFEVIETVARAANKNTSASISYRRPSTKHGAGAKPKLIIGIPMRIAENFKPKANQRFALQVGTGADAGKARIEPIAAGGVTPVIVKGGVTFRFGFVPMLGTDAADKEFIEARATKLGFEIDLPAWFKPD